jgi:hypothetical protein
VPRKRIENQDEASADAEASFVEEAEAEAPEWSPAPDAEAAPLVEEPEVGAEPEPEPDPAYRDPSLTYVKYVGFFDVRDVYGVAFPRERWVGVNEEVLEALVGDYRVGREFVKEVRSDETNTEEKVV